MKSTASGHSFVVPEALVRAMGLPNDVAPVTEECRRTIGAKIAVGMASLRAGRSTDGESFMTAMDAELAELERQGHK